MKILHWFMRENLRNLAKNVYFAFYLKKKICMLKNQIDFYFAMIKKNYYEEGCYADI